MNNILIISGTNRKKSNSFKVSTVYMDILKDLGYHSEILDLVNLPDDALSSALYENAGKNSDFNALLEKVNNADKIIFVVAEYNGSFPGALKVFIDGLDFVNSFKNKKAAMVGISNGNQGAALALSHLADILSFMGAHVLAFRPRLPELKEHFEDGVFKTEQYFEILKKQAKSLIEF